MPPPHSKVHILTMSSILQPPTQSFPTPRHGRTCRPLRWPFPAPGTLPPMSPERPHLLEPPPLGPALQSLLKPAATSLIPAIFYLLFISNPSDLCFLHCVFPQTRHQRCSMPSLMGPWDPRIWPVGRSWLYCPQKRHTLLHLSLALPGAKDTLLEFLSVHLLRGAGSPVWDGVRVPAQQGPSARATFPFTIWFCLWLLKASSD